MLPWCGVAFASIMQKQRRVNIVFLETFDLLLQWTRQAAWTPDTGGHAQNAVQAIKVSIAILQRKAWVFYSGMTLLFFATLSQSMKGLRPTRFPKKRPLGRGDHPTAASLGLLELKCFRSVWADTVRRTRETPPSFVIPVPFKWLTIMLALALVVLFLCRNI